MLKLAPTCGVVIQVSPFQSSQQHIGCVYYHMSHYLEIVGIQSVGKEVGCTKVSGDSAEKKKPNVFMKVCTILQEECKVCKKSGARRR